MTGSPGHEWLDGLGFFGIKFGLDNIRALLDALGNPERRLRMVHVAGTNGKGSTLAFLDAMLHAAGYRTARFTSPHLIHVNERFLLNGEPAPTAQLERHLHRLQAVAARLDIRPTYFEVCTAAAFSLFEESRVDLALIETGMGGRLDSTNVVTPLATAITTIGMDHMQYLGNTLAEIAAEKAGIIKPACPLVVGRVGPEAAGVIAERAQAYAAPICWLDRDLRLEITGVPWRPVLACNAPSGSVPATPLALAGFHQAENAAIACALAQTLSETFPRLDASAIVAGLRNARWPCRLERVSESPPVVLDAAHNPDGMRHYAHLFSRAVVLFAASSDKDAAGMLESLQSFADPLVLTAYPGGRAADPTWLAQLPGAQPSIVCPSLEEAIDEALARATEQTPLLVTGSIFLAGAVRARLEQRGVASPLHF